MKYVILVLVVCGLILGATSLGLAEQQFKGMHLKMLACGDTAVTRLVKILDEFERKTGIKVTIDMYPYPGLIDKVVVETSAKSPTYQLFWIDSPWIGQLGEAGALYDLTPLAIRDYEEAGIGDIIPVQIQENSWQGKLLAFPASGMCWFMHYRKDLFEDPVEKANFLKEYGYELDVPKTWKQYRDIAEFFTRQPGEKLAGKVLEQPFYGCSQAYSRVQGAITHDYFGIMRSFGGEFWGEDGFCVMNQEPHVKAAEFMKSLLPYNPPDALSLMWDLRTGYFERGECALSCYWTVRTVRLENPEEAKVATIGNPGYAKNPTYQGMKAPTYTGCLSFAINSRVSKKEAEAAWEFIKWGCGEEVCRKLASMGISQFRRSILADPELQEKYPYYKAILECSDAPLNSAGYSDVAKRRIFHPFYTDVEEIFGLELNRAMMGEQTCEEALDRATNAINARLAMFSEDTRKRWITDVKCEVLD